MTGQAKIQSDLIEFGRGLLHEIPNQLGMVRSVTRAERAVTPRRFPAWWIAPSRVRAGRVRPVEIEMPPDTLFATGEVRLLPGAELPERYAGDHDLIGQAAELLAGAQKP